MKNTLLCIMALLVVFMTACKKDNDPWADIDFARVNNYHIKFDADNNVIAYSINNNANVGFDYQSNTLVYFNHTNGNPYYTSYYVNGHAYADSVYEYFDNGPVCPVMLKRDFLSYNQGFIIDDIYSIGYGTSTFDTIHYINDGNNITQSSKDGIPTFYNYADTLAKVDIWNLDNELTGKNNRNLIKHIVGNQSVNPTEDFYYYQLNSEGYVTAYYTKHIVHAQTDIITNYRYNFTYEFVY